MGRTFSDVKLRVVRHDESPMAVVTNKKIKILNRLKFPNFIYSSIYLFSLIF